MNSARGGLAGEGVGVVGVVGMTPPLAMTAAAVSAPPSAINGTPAIARLSQANAPRRP